MAIVKVIPASDLESDFVTKYNNTTDEIYVNAATSGQNFVLTKNGGGNTTVTRMITHKINPSYMDALCYNDQQGLNVSSQTGSAVLSGINNKATMLSSVVTGGGGNIASGIMSIVANGSQNMASNDYTSVLGGHLNTASTVGAAIIGGSANTTSANYAVALGGQSVIASKANTAHANNFGLQGGYFYVQTGTSKSSGVVTLVAGQALVSNVLVTNATMFQLSHQNTSGTLGHLYISGRTAGTSFSIGSSSATDTSTVSYLMIEPY